jgi:ectoine hydroxylase-related dioxygenase (phytanoyl-CoA dioxygenase family)
MKEIGGITHKDAEEILKGETPREILEYYNTPYAVSQEQIDFYNENGFIIVKGVLNGEPLKHVKKIMESAVLIRKKEDQRTLAQKSEYEQSFLQCGFLAFDWPIVRDFVFAKRFAGIARDIMKVSGTRLWHDQALFKEAHGRATPVHQDSSYWPVSNPELTTTIWLSINGATKEKGCLYFYPQTHKTQKEYVDIFKNPHQPEHLKTIDKAYCELQAGDATFHSGLTFHASDGNSTEEMREAMTVIYISDGNRFDASDDRNATHKSCIGLKDGEIINTIYTPKLV